MPAGWTRRANLRGPRGPQGLPGVNATPADLALAGYIGTPATVSNTRTQMNKQYKLGQSVRAYGAVGDGVTNDSAAIAAAHDAWPVVVYPDGDFLPGAEDNLYIGSGPYTNALGPRWMGGTPAAPLVRAEPIMWVQKHSIANRATNPSEWDQGGIYSSLIKQAGNAYGAALTGYGRHESADGGQLIGIHGRASAHDVNSEIWGMWSYAYTPAGVVAKSIIGHEINVSNKATDQGWRETGSSTPGVSRGLVVVTSDASNPISHGIYIGRNSAAPDGHIHSGLFIMGGGIAPSPALSATVITDNEAIRLEGSSVGSAAANGIRLRNGWFRTGISFAEASFDNNAAIVLGDGQRIMVGPGGGVSRFVSFNVTGTHVNFNNLTLRVNDTDVVGTRKTGWAAATGTGTRSTFATSSVTLPVLAEHVKALIDDLTTHGLIGA